MGLQIENLYRVRVTTRFLATTLLLSALLAFSGGLFAAKHFQKWEFASRSQKPQPVKNNITTWQDSIDTLHFEPVETHLQTPAFESEADDDEDDHDGGGDGDGDERTLQYLIDIKAVDEDILTSKERLLDVLFDLIEVLGIGPTLSHHCHKSEGIYCVAMLQDLGHASILSWPAAQSVSLDIFAEDAPEPSEVVASVEKLFATSNDLVKWNVKKRGFRPVINGEVNLEDIEFDQCMFGNPKQFVAEEHTNFQTIDIVDVINPKLRPGLAEYRKSLHEDDSYHSHHPELFRPDRMIYLDRVMQSRLFGEAAYHEALVHPAMVSHPNPRRVAIIGGGEGATLREVLKHKTVEHVAMIEIDQIMVEVCMELLPEWNYCGNLVGSSLSCFDDPRAEIYFEDAVAWFLKRFQVEESIDPSQRYDVIIMDALDPNSATPFSDYLYSNSNFTIALSSSLNSNGVLVSQVGESDESDEVGDHLSNKKGAEIFKSDLEQHGFQVVDFFEESHGGFMAPWTYLVAFKDLKGRRQWGSNQAEIDRNLHWRAMQTVEGSTPFRYFDGASMMGYHFPSRLDQEAQCRNRPAPPLCLDDWGFRSELPHAPASVLKAVTGTSVNSEEGALVAQKNIPNGGLLAIDDVVQDLVLPAKTMALIHEMSNAFFMNNKWKPLEAYLRNNSQSVAGYSGEFMVAMSATSSMMLFLGAFDTDKLPREITDTILFSRNTLVLQKAVSTTIAVRAGEKLAADLVGGSLIAPEKLAII